MDVRSILVVPLLREGEAIGTINVYKVEPEPFPDAQIALLKTFADQAVIAIENVRLFTELQASNSDLTTALETQSATSDILRVISRSQTDAQPVFDAIVTSAVRLLRAHSGSLTRLVGEQIELAALTSTDNAGDANLRETFPRSLHSAGSIAHAIRDRAPLNVDRHRGRSTKARSLTCDGPSPWVPKPGGGAAAPSRRSNRGDCRHPPRTRRVHRRRDRAPQDLRRPGRDRHRERAAVHGAGGAQPRSHRVPRPADRHERDPAGDQHLANGSSASAGRGRQERHALLWRPRRSSSTAARRRTWRWPPTTGRFPLPWAV